MLKAKVAVAKKRSNNTKKKAAYMKRARQGMRGFALLWTGTGLNDIESAIVDNSNPIQKLISQSMWDQCKSWILTTEFVWEVTMRMIHTGTASGDKYDDAIFNFTCTLRGEKAEILHEEIQKAFEGFIAGNNAYPDGHKNKGIYSHCEFLAQIVGV